jgi:5S rRNA maturation endonuclease (ribonuclease M5)
MAVAPAQRFKKDRRCPICDGCEDDPRGKGVRCSGFVSTDGDWAHCSREDHAGAIELEKNGTTYAHRLRGPCKCGKQHGDAVKRRVAEYPYFDEHGSKLYDVVRFENPKDFRPLHSSGQWTFGARRVIYRLPELLAADPGELVFVVEGEKDVDNLRRLGAVAVCNPMGAGKWGVSEESARSALDRRRVVIIPDRDRPGRDHALDVARRLEGVAIEVRILELNVGKDASDWIDRGGTLGDLKLETARALDPATYAASLRDEDPATTEIDADHTTTRRWIVDLGAFLGDEEPSDDDREDWNIRDIVPRGESLLIAGPPKSGKTWAMLDLAIALAMGLPWLTHENCVAGPVRVLVLAFEDGLRRLRKRVWELCRARGITPNDATLRENLRISREPLRLPGNEADFTAELKQWKPSNVLIDNLTRVMDGDPNATKDAARFGNTWTKLGGDVGAGVGFLHHTTKIGPLAFGARNDGDPFELVKGNGDFVAVARHVVLMRPIDALGGKLADVRMRGNLDLRRENFVLGFERIRDRDRWLAKIDDRGDGDTVRAQIAAAKKERIAADKAADHAAEFERRRNVALKILNETGACSQATLADALGLRSPNTVKSVFQSLVGAEVVKPDKVRGYVFVDKDEPS